MFSFGKSKRVVSLVIDDYVIRMVESNGHGLDAVKVLSEKALPIGLIEHGKVADDILFYDFMKELVVEWDIKNQQVQFYVSNGLVIMRQVSFPKYLKVDEINEHFMLQIGESLHLPFENPVFDVHTLAPTDYMADESQREELQGTLFAVPEDDVMRYTDIFLDVSLKPIAADVQALGVYRYFYELHRTTNDKVYMFFELNLTSINLSIFHSNQLDFMRFQDLGVEAKDWISEADESGKLHWNYEGDKAALNGIVEDQINELDRIMNFYRYSLHKGEKVVTDIIILGDYPNIAAITKRIESQYDLQITLLKGYLSEEKQEDVGITYVPALGLALKGGSIHDS